MPVAFDILLAKGEHLSIGTARVFCLLPRPIVVEQITVGEAMRCIIENDGPPFTIAELPATAPYSAAG
ncbi:MAG TPA: hypothetical protein EYP49_19190 [Anaerolineae bacterium]|nr:hypothetical protein [Anaerolineae bacterium]